MEPANEFLVCGGGILVFGLPVPDQTLSVDHERDVLLNVHENRFGFSLERIHFSMPNV
jgi:hypothetical protein